MATPKLPTIDVAGLPVVQATKRELLATLAERLAAGEPTFLVTAYSEFLYRAILERETGELLRSADLIVADGVGVSWAARFLSLPLSARSFWGRAAQASWQAALTLCEIIVAPRRLNSVIPEQIQGSGLVFDLCEMAAAQGKRVFFLGGYGTTPAAAAAAVARELAKKNLALTVAGTSNRDAGDPEIIRELAAANADVVLVAFGPLKQERWIAAHIGKVPGTLFVGLGGTFDYLAGVRTAPPGWVRSVGLEWLWRLFTQPARAGRIWRAMPGLVELVARFKVFRSLPYRQNAVAVIVNGSGGVLTCRRIDTFINDATTKAGGHWQLPQGGIEPGEDPKTAAVREAGEEVGLTGLTDASIGPSRFTYDWPEQIHRWFSGPHWHYRGQQQHLVYLRYRGDPESVSVDGREFNGFRWVSARELPASLHPFRRGLAEIVRHDLLDGDLRDWYNGLLKNSPHG